MVMLAGVGATAVAMKEGARGMKETATTRVAEATAVGASITAIATVVAASGTDVRTQLAEARGTKSPRMVLHHHLPRAEVVAVAGSQDLSPPIAEKASRTKQTE